VRAYALVSTRFLPLINKIETFLTTHHLGGEIGSYVGLLDEATVTALVELTER
jgi:hypothetical protein